MLARRSFSEGGWTLYEKIYPVNCEAIFPERTEFQRCISRLPRAQSKGARFSRLWASRNFFFLIRPAHPRKFFYPLIIAEKSVLTSLKSAMLKYMIVIGIILLIIGLSMFYRPTLEWFVKINNSMRGIATNITNTTIITYRTVGIIFIILGILIMTGILHT